MCGSEIGWPENEYGQYEYNSVDPTEYKKILKIIPGKTFGRALFASMELMHNICITNMCQWIPQVSALSTYIQRQAVESSDTQLLSIVINRLRISFVKFLTYKEFQPCTHWTQIPMMRSCIIGMIQCWSFHATSVVQVWEWLHHLWSLVYWCDAVADLHYWKNPLTLVLFEIC